MSVTIQSSEVVYKGWSTMRRLTLNDGQATFTREVEDHGSAVGVLPFDPERRVALLVRMPRAPVLAAGDADLLEVPAGLVDPDEDEEACGRREALEETGVALGAMTSVGTVWTCPGLSTERIALFVASYTAADRTSAGGGLAAENENITVVEMPLATLAELADAGQLTDLKTFALLQSLRLRRPDLFS
jgi:nudix-type nucleoside diphosphatase (YffH/AdpP family)